MKSGEWRVESGEWRQSRPPWLVTRLVTLTSPASQVFERGTTMDPVDIARQAYSYALENGFDTMIVDTAGRQVCAYKVHMYLHVNMCMYIYIYLYISIYIYIYIYIYMYMYVCVYIYTYAYIYIFISMYISISLPWLSYPRSALPLALLPREVEG